jgi:hypothetical protein
MCWKNEEWRGVGIVVCLVLLGWILFDGEGRVAGFMIECRFCRVYL